MAANEASCGSCWPASPACGGGCSGKGLSPPPRLGPLPSSETEQPAGAKNPDRAGGDEKRGGLGRDWSMVNPDDISGWTSLLQPGRVPNRVITHRLFDPVGHE